MSFIADTVMVLHFEKVAILIHSLMLVLAVSKSISAYALEPCSPNKTGAEIRDFRKIADDLEGPINDAKSYFVLACQLPNSTPKSSPAQIRDGIEGHIPNSTLGTSIPMVDRKNRKTKDFLGLVLSKIKETQKINMNATLSIQECTRMPKSESCKPEVTRWLNQDLHQIAKAARSTLAVSMSSASRTSNEDPTKINRDLSPLGTKKTNPWSKLNPEEERAAQDTLQKLIEAIARNHPNPELDPKIYKQRREKLLEARELYLFLYHAIIGIHPLLQHLKSENPTQTELYQMAQKTLRNLSVESALLKGPEEALNKPYSLGRAGSQTYSDKVLDLLKYRVEVEQVLIEHPEFCGLAISLRQVEESKKTTREIIHGAALVGFLFLGTVPAIAMGAATTSWEIGQAQLKNEEAQVRLDSRVISHSDSELKSIMKETDSGKLREQLSRDISAVTTRFLYEAKLSENEVEAALFDSAINLAPGGLNLLRTPLANTLSKFRSRLTGKP